MIIACGLMCILIMWNMDPIEFENIVTEAIEAIPKPFSERIENVAFIIEAIPSNQQRHQLGLHCNQTLYGLYEGVPLPQRNGAVKLLPDKITIFREPILLSSGSRHEVVSKVKNTVWHEVAHYFGLDHDRIHELESRS